MDGVGIPDDVDSLLPVCCQQVGKSLELCLDIMDDVDGLITAPAPADLGAVMFFGVLTRNTYHTTTYDLLDTFLIWDQIRACEDTLMAFYLKN